MNKALRIAARLLRTVASEIENILDEDLDEDKAKDCCHNPWVGPLQGYKGYPSPEQYEEFYPQCSDPNAGRKNGQGQ